MTTLPTIKAEAVKRLREKIENVVWGEYAVAEESISTRDVDNLVDIFISEIDRAVDATVKEIRKSFGHGNLWEDSEKRINSVIAKLNDLSTLTKDSKEENG